MDFNIFPAPELGQVPPGVTWVEIPVYSQNLDMVEQISLRLANLRGKLRHLIDTLSTGMRASYAAYDTHAWCDREVPWDAEAAQRMGLPEGHVLGRSTEAVLRIEARTREELDAAACIALQTEAGAQHPVRNAWQVGDIRVRGDLPEELAGFQRAILNHRPMGAGDQVFLSLVPLHGWSHEAVMVNERHAALLQP